MLQKPFQNLARATVASVLMLVSCQTLNTQPSPPQAPPPVVTFLAAEAPQSVAPASVPKPHWAVTETPGASIRFALQWSRPEDSNPERDFQTQLACTVNTDLNHFKIYLLRAETSLGSILPLSLGTLLNPVEGPFTIGKKALTSPSGSETFVLNNVPEGKYYIAMSAHNASDTNITGTSTTSPTGLLGINLVAVSNGGGNVGSPGRVEVGPAPTFAILNGTEPPLTLNLKLSSLLCLL